MDQVPALGMSESSVEGEIEDANSNSVSRRGHGKEKHRTDKAQTGTGGSQGTLIHTLGASNRKEMRNFLVLSNFFVSCLN